MFIVNKNDETSKLTVRKRVKGSDTEAIKTIVSAILELILNKLFKQKGGKNG
jgi:hypothetical protein